MQTSLVEISLAGDMERSNLEKFKQRSFAKGLGVESTSPLARLVGIVAGVA